MALRALRLPLECFYRLQHSSMLTSQGLEFGVQRWPDGSQAVAEPFRTLLIGKVLREHLGQGVQQLADPARLLCCSEFPEVEVDDATVIAFDACQDRLV